MAQFGKQIVGPDFTRSGCVQARLRVIRSGFADLLIDRTTVRANRTIDPGRLVFEVGAAGPADGATESIGDGVDDGSDGDESGSDDGNDRPSHEVDERNRSEDTAEEYREDAQSQLMEPVQRGCSLLPTRS